MGWDVLSEHQEQPSEWKNQARGSTSLTTPPIGNPTLERSQRGVLGQEIPGTWLPGSSQIHL